MSRKNKEITNIEDLVPDPKNANKGTQRGGAMLERSLRTLGAGRSILADKNGVVVAGNKTLERAFEIGLRIKPVHTRGDELVVVIRDDLELDGETDGGRARQLAYADNRISQVDYDLDPEQLALDLSEEGVLAPDDLDWLYNENEIDALLGTVPNFEPVGIDEQGRLDEKKQVECPHCKQWFTP